MFLFCFGRCFYFALEDFLYCFGRCFYIALDDVFILLLTMLLHFFGRCFYIAFDYAFTFLRSMFLYCFWLFLYCFGRCFYFASVDVFILLWSMFLYCFWLCFYIALDDIFILLWTMFYIASVDVFILLWTMLFYYIGLCSCISSVDVFILLCTTFYIALDDFLCGTSTRRVFRKGGTIIYPRGGINLNPPLGRQAELKRQCPQADCVSRAPSILTWLGLLLYSIITWRGFRSPSELCRNITASSNTGLRQSKEHVRSRRMKPAYKCVMLPVVCPRWCMYIQMRLFVKYIKQSCSLKMTICRRQGHV
jgi:hypothetical protein